MSMNEKRTSLMVAALFAYGDSWLRSVENLKEEQIEREGFSTLTDYPAAIEQAEQNALLCFELANTAPWEWPRDYTLEELDGTNILEDLL
jgi:hypothetical protein